MSRISKNQDCDESLYYVWYTSNGILQPTSQHKTTKDAKDRAMSLFISLYQQLGSVDYICVIRINDDYIGTPYHHLDKDLFTYGKIIYELICNDY